MLTRELGFGVFASAVLTIVALPLVACGQVKGADEASGNGSGGRGGSSGASGSGQSGGSSGATGGSRGGSSGATGGSSGDAGMTGTGGTGVAGDGAAGGGEEESAQFHWIEATEEHRELAAASAKPALLRTRMRPPYDAPVLTGTSELILGERFIEELHTEAIVWSEATGTVGLGGLPGGAPPGLNALSEPRAISADGSVVVGVAANSQGGFVPFRWTRDDGMEALAEDGEAVALSADGSVVVGVRSLPAKGVFRWTRALGAVTIVEPLEGDDELRVLALSPDGATVLGVSSREDTAERLFVWEVGAGTRGVENLPGYPWCAAGFARFNGSHGFVVGGACMDEEVSYEPFLWAGEDNLVALGQADALGGYEPKGLAAVTADRSVGFGSATNSAFESRAYRWTEANGFELIELPDGYTSSALATGRAAMSEDGSVVVGRLHGTNSHSFLWSASAGAVLLSPFGEHYASFVVAVSADGSLAAGTSRLGTEDPRAVYWRADGVAHSIAEELAAEGIDLGAGVLYTAHSVHAPLTFLGYGSKDDVSTELAWRARLP